MENRLLPTADELAELPAAELRAVLAQVERVRRQAEALLAEATHVVTQRGLHRGDGHRRVTAWGRAEFNWSPVEALRISRNGAAMAAMPLLRDAAHEGIVGVAQLSEFGRVFANPRCAEHLPASDDLLTPLAHQHWFREFRVALDRWVSLADPDGAQQSHRDAHEGRRASIRQVGDIFILHAECGTDDGPMLQQVLEHFCDAEFIADWAEGRERLGDDVCVAGLVRTHAQRSFDALRSIFNTAAATPLDHVAPEPLVNIVADQRTAEEVLRQAAGEHVPAPDPREFLTRRCETVDGVQLSRQALLEALLLSRLRRVVFDESGVVIDLGRASRLFRGGARDALLLAALRCLWPGCEVRTGRCQSDHTTPWSAGGTTSPGNGGRACSHHNRHKHHGYTVRRDAHGHWHTYRPDGTEIGEHGRTIAA